VLDESWKVLYKQSCCTHVVAEDVADRHIRRIQLAKQYLPRRQVRTGRLHNDEQTGPANIKEQPAWQAAPELVESLIVSLVPSVPRSA
jgi:hypothetical protein